jgi:hypothetical protein
MKEVIEKESDSSNYLGLSAGSTMIGVPTVSTEPHSDSMFGINHRTSSDIDDNQDNKEDDVTTVNEYDYKEEISIATTSDSGDDIIPHNNKKKAKKNSTTNPATVATLVINCALAYEQCRNSKAALLAMGIGLTDLAIDTNAEPYLSSKNRRSFVPSKQELIYEIHRRAIAIGLTGKLLPKADNWYNTK